MNFSDVKSLTIPEGTVKQILINGVVVWPAVATLVSITLSGYNSSLNQNSNFIY